MFRLLAFLFFGLATFSGAQAEKNPEFWVGKTPTDLSEETKASLLSHPYFQNMSQNRQYYSRSQLKQSPYWFKASLLQLSYRSPWFYYAVEGCTFTRPASLVRPTLTKGAASGTAQDYVMFYGDDCQLSSDPDIGTQSVAFMLPAINYDAPEPPVDTTVYVCAEAQNRDDFLLSAFPITYEYFARDRQYYYIAMTYNVRERDVGKPFGSQICNGRDNEAIAQTLIDIAYPNIPTKREGQERPADDTAGEVCYMEAREFARADGGPGGIDYVRVCE